MIAAPRSGTKPAPALGARRVWVGFGLALGGVAAVFFAPAFALLVLAIAIGSLCELGKLAERKGVALEFGVAAMAITAYVALTYFRLIGRYEGDLLSLTVVVAISSATFMSRGNQIMRSAFTLLGVLYIGKLISYFVAIRGLPEIGVQATIYAITVIALTDVGAMLVGTTLGRTLLTPLSPRKTVEGALGGLLAGTLASIGFALYLHWPWWNGAVIGVLTSLAAQAGDLVESAIKRDAAVKDAGSAIAGHGGVLDRFDSYLFGGIAFYFALVLVGVIPIGSA